jgi:hypothetical protein
METYFAKLEGRPLPPVPAPPAQAPVVGGDAPDASVVDAIDAPLEGTP